MEYLVLNVLKLFWAYFSGNLSVSITEKLIYRRLALLHSVYNLGLTQGFVQRKKMEKQEFQTGKISQARHCQKPQTFPHS